MFDVNVAFIPVRGGSKSIPLKNIKPIAGKPLVYWTARAAVNCPQIDRVYVATDSELIRQTVESFDFAKLEVISRSEQSATDTASTESAMLEFAEAHEFDSICLIQATSPLLTSEDLSRGFSLMEGADSVLSVVRQKRFIWRQNCDRAAPVNYDYNARPRRQEFDGFLVENGAFYITSRLGLLNSKCRLSGKIRTVEMSEESYFEIDEPSDWVIIEKLLEARTRSFNRSMKIKMFLTDCDGTLTDGGMYYSAEGDVMKKFNTRDGVGLRLLKERGLITGIVTGENSSIVKKRGEKLGVDEIVLGVQDKVECVRQLCRKHNIAMNEVAFIGDDLNDAELMKVVGLAICPADAVQAVKNNAHHVTQQPGGRGAVREAAQFISNFIF